MSNDTVGGNDLSRPPGADAVSRVAERRDLLWKAGFRPVALYNADQAHTAAGTAIAFSSRGKVPIGRSWAERARSATPEAVTRVPDCRALNDGILCDGLRVVDIDVDGLTLVAELKNLAVKMLGATIARVRENSARCALLYRAAKGQPSKREIEGSGGKIEILGFGQQVHAFGAHYSGVELMWFPEPPNVRGVDGIPAVTEEQITAFLVAAATLIGAVSPNASARSGRASPNVTGTLSALGPPPLIAWPQGLPDMAAAGARSRYSPAEVRAAAQSIPDGCPGHPLASRKAWLEEFVFPLADYAARHPEHATEVRQLFSEQTRRIVDHSLATQYRGGETSYFASAEAVLQDEIRRAKSATRSERITIGRLIHSTLGNLEEAVASGWGGRWDGLTSQHRAAGVVSPTLTPARPGNVTSFFTPVRTAPAHLRGVPWLVGELLIRGDLTVLAGQGGGAKTAFAVMLSVALAAGRSRCGPIKLEQQPGGLRAGFISAEEDPNRLGLLVAAAGMMQGLNQAEWAAVERNLRIHDARSSGWVIAEPRPGAREDVPPERDDGGLAVLRDAMANFRPALLVMDTAAALIGLQNENANSAVTSVMRRLGRAAADHDCAILLLHHTPKMTRETAAAQRGEATLVRGGGAWGNSARVVVSITAPSAKEGAQFALIGADPARIRRLEHVKINDQLEMVPVYFETKSANVTIHDGTDVSVRAISFLKSVPLTGGASNAVRNLVMKAIDTGAIDKQGARVPLSPAGSGGAKNERDAVAHVARALMASNGGLNQDQAKSAARDVLRELQDDIGCVVRDDNIAIPKYKPNGSMDGTRPGKGLVTRWDLAPWASPPAQVGTSGAAAPAPPSSPPPPTCAPSSPSGPVRPSNEPVQPPDAVAAANPEHRGSAGIPFMITNAMKGVLRRLGYSGEDIRGMTPQQAFEIVERRSTPVEDRPSNPSTVLS